MCVLQKFIALGMSKLNILVISLCRVTIFDYLCTKF